ncbi:vegetative cell wall protein gp1-like [Nematostella vectensis]|uniref:vegetative cell wall protein gp1-like n=2 Tax=Nematostella vectensis TaxID=45351 RepID=UPI002076E0D1|nr:vegetative cell wall protein gp1-like [Nematostella vectensis]
MEGIIPLHFAGQAGKTEVAKVLLRSGAAESIHIENSNGKTPVQLAKESGHSDTLKLVSYDYGSYTFPLPLENYFRKLRKCAKGKLTFCDHVKIDWGLNQADDFTDDVIELTDIKTSLSDDEALNDVRLSSKGKSGPPTPPRHRRNLPPRPVSQMIMPSSRQGRSQEPTSMSSLLAGLSLQSNDSHHGLANSPWTRDMSASSNASPVVMRRKAPVPPRTTGETVPISVRQSVALPSSTNVATGSTFGHGVKSWQDETSPSDVTESPPPIPPIRCPSVSRPVRPTGPPSPPKPQFHDTPTRASPPPDMRTNPDTERRPPPLPPAPKRAIDLKPDFPPVPTHKRSKSDGKVPFGEDIADMGRPALEKKSSFPLGEGEKDDSKASRPELPPRPTGLEKPANTGRVSNDVGLTKNAPNKPKSTTLPRPSVTPPPPRRQDSDTTVKVYPPNKDKPLPKVQENSKVGDTPAPEIPSRNYSSQVPVSQFPRRVQALNDCEADNDDNDLWRVTSFSSKAKVKTPSGGLESWRESLGIAAFSRSVLFACSRNNPRTLVSEPISSTFSWTIYEKFGQLPMQITSSNCRSTKL